MMSARLYSCVVAVCISQCLSFNASAADQGRSPDLYSGIGRIFEKSETYSSLLGGQLIYLTAGGYDEFHDAADAVLISGEISKETVANFVNVQKRHPIKTVYFDSPGGDLYAGLQLGQLIHKFGLGTGVSESAECASACALAFIAGKVRLISGTAKIFGFHRQYFIVDGKIKYGDWKKDVKVIKNFLDNIDFKGLSAEEIVSTTGLVTFSENSLVQRGIVSESSGDTAGWFASYLNHTGLSDYEKLRLKCMNHRDKPAEIQSDDTHVFLRQLNQITIYHWCSALQPAMREPMIYEVLNSTNEDDDQKLLKVIGLARQFLRENNYDIELLNRTFMGNEDYESYLRKRRSLGD